MHVSFDEPVSKFRRRDCLGPVRAPIRFNSKRHAEAAPKSSRKLFGFACRRRRVGAALQPTGEMPRRNGKSGQKQKENAQGGEQPRTPCRANRAHRLREVDLVALAPGKSSTRRAAISSGDRPNGTLFGTDAISDVSRSVARSRGICARLMASAQGSTSSRASAEMVLKCGPFPMSPIEANRKLSNSGPASGVSAACVMSSTKSLVLHGGPRTQRRSRAHLDRKSRSRRNGRGREGLQRQLLATSSMARFDARRGGRSQPGALAVARALLPHAPARTIRPRRIHDVNSRKYQGGRDLFFLKSIKSRNHRS